MSTIKNIKVLFVANNNINNIGGIEQHITQLSLNLKNNNITVDYLFPKDRLFINNKIPNYKSFAKLKDNFDIIHFHGFSAVFVILLAFFAKKDKNAKWVYTPHMHPFNKHRYPILAKLFFSTFTKIAIKKMDNIIAVSKAEKDFFLSLVNKNIICLIPNGIKKINQNPLAKEKRKHLLFVGRYDDNKRPWIIEKIAHNFSTTNFIFVINKTINSLQSNIVYKNNIKEDKLYELYNKAIATIIPSKYEAFSLVALESLAAGTPVIIAENVQIKEYFNENIITICKENKLKKDLIIAINNVINMDNKLFEKYSNEATYAAKDFLWSNVSNKVIDLYHK
jgi:glycosyltransferase involved in cell wall biosynthesis